MLSIVSADPPFLHGPHRAFTLVESLVAVVLVGVLVMLLVPSLQKALIQAKVTHSLGNMRQIGQMIGLFYGENDGSLPCGWNPEAKQTWYQQFSLAGLIDYKKDRGVLVCPLMNTVNGKENISAVTSYAMNNFLGDRSNKQAWEGINKIQSASQLSATAVLFNSFYHPGSQRWKFSATPGDGYNQIVPGDRKHVNVLFLDGSAQVLPASDSRLTTAGKRGGEEWLFWTGNTK